ncbi:DUF932 domain-containing protein [Fluviispira sanaruensis]|uniref:DUF945 domain-containing protein n=1 Tax=Fluviispira sanaruensis TaxID=2493639 RepID=A0A4P2VR59_FLUSA|nr:DUF932 domain-containing protein [Fluviispira sanaruensis]BBH54734.1 DUF945 domain-containing protein [Fluviispira sanaruensis]
MSEFRNFNGSHLTIEQLKKICPAAFASNPKNSVSDKYSFISTEKILNILSQNNFLPYSAYQSSARSEEKALTTKHLIKFRSASDKTFYPLLGGLIPEIILSTSHDGLSSFRFSGGIFRLVCTNGLVVADGSCSNYNIRHMGASEEEIIDAVFEVLSSTTNAVTKTYEMKQIELNQSQKFKFAEEAFQLRWDIKDAPDFSPLRLLEPKRSSDRSNDLFTIFNAAQEKLIRGGIRYYSKNLNGDLERNRTRAINSIDANLKINKGLWSLAEKYLEGKY